MSRKTKASLSEEVYEYIKRMILTLELKCGEKIPEELIASQLNVSRTPIREALRRLAGDGLVVIYPNRHAEVVTLTDEDIRQLGDMRMMLDVLAAQLAVHNGSNAEFLELKKVADRCEEAFGKGNRYERIRLDNEFHLKLTKIGKNKLLYKFQQELLLKVHLVQSFEYSKRADSYAMIEPHQRIIESLMRRDVAEVTKNVILNHQGFYGAYEKEGGYTLQFPDFTQTIASTAADRSITMLTMDS